MLGLLRHAKNEKISDWLSKWSHFKEQSGKKYVFALKTWSCCRNSCGKCSLLRKITKEQTRKERKKGKQKSRRMKIIKMLRIKKEVVRKGAREAN